MKLVRYFWVAALLVFFLMAPANALAAGGGKAFAFAELGGGRLSHNPAVFRCGRRDRLLSEEVRDDGRGFLSGGSEDDGVDRGPKLYLRQPQLARDDGLERHGLPVRHARGARIPDWRHPGDSVPRAGHDAVLLHLQDSLGAGVSEAAVRRGRAVHRRDFLHHPDADGQRVIACSPWRRSCICCSGGTCR